MRKGAGNLAREAVRDLEAYSEEAGRGGLNLMNNTNLFGPNPAIAQAVSHARPGSYWDYPSIDSAPLRQAASRAWGVPPEWIVTGNGSNEILDVLIRAFAGPGEPVAYHPPTFSMIPAFIQTNGAAPVPVPLRRQDFGLDANALIDAGAKVTFVCRPNNPTGNAFPRADVRRIVQESEGIVAVDEAYIEFAEGRSFVEELPDHPNLVVLRTLSKAHGLAGLRIGFGLAHPDVCEELAKVRGPFRLNAFSEAAGTIALRDARYVDRVVGEVKDERARLARVLTEMGFRVFPSEANFLLVNPPVDAQKLAEALASRGVYVRDFQGDLAHLVRVTVGPPTVTARFLAVLRDVLGGIA